MTIRRGWYSLWGMTTPNRTTIDQPGLPSGWYIEREDHDTQIVLSIFEEGGATWKQTGDPRSALDVTVYKPGPFREEAEVTWPSTSDNRPILAHAVAVAISIAAEEADVLNGPGERGTF